MEGRVKVSNADVRVGTFKVERESANILRPGVLGVFREQIFMGHLPHTILEC